MTKEEFILKIIEIVIFLLMGTGGIFALVKTILTINKKSKRYEVRCKMAAELIRSGIVKVSPEEAKDLLIKVLDDKFDETDPKVVNKIIRKAEKQNQTK